MYGVLPASSPCLQQAPGCVPSPEQAGETFSVRIHAGSAGSRAPCLQARERRGVRANRGNSNPHRCPPLLLKRICSIACTYQRGKGAEIGQFPVHHLKLHLCSASQLPPKAQTHPHRLLSLQSLDTTIHPETRVIYREICCQQLVEKAEPKTPFGSGMLRHIFKWMSCGKAYCIL